MVMSLEDQECASVENLQGNKVWIRVRTTDRDFKAVFFYSLDGVHFRRFGKELSMGLGLPWTANRFALFNFSTTQEGVDGVADFNWFRFTDK